MELMWTNYSSFSYVEKEETFDLFEQEYTFYTIKKVASLIVYK